ncbi:hypothetical protein [Salmonella enterica]|uniref:hypothetical protein n=1 Tax=Salmonella enterica TaxID=28901 RepID=UPI000779694D|nr:hypothetical protein [Salmonella enterica]KYF19547.1 hypothetical protein AIZ04_16190 [Salmonella enterica subsp. enterica serovar Typhimurium]KYF19557.1 hypothetical protein AIZ04_16240 [Salmonella enterica subsp. enterica serovar Typhimurium]KYI63493.1 hypothetical protein AIZ18_18505 [Salmonella enterica subsp. enterica serovar Typhimurium]KYI63503.1 hypothetical protein AIZ18_18555 [Salmonella enterica subsp. enterica serovar Typhimurium]KYI64820.1 hypothetical protein AIZ19_18150 [Salm
MSGFEVYNSAGKLLVDSQNRSTLFYDQRSLGAVTEKGFYSVDSPFGDGSTLGFTQQQFWNDGNLRWLQLDANKYGLPGADLLEDNAGRMIRTARNIGMQSGYLDVFDAGGNLIWSAASASKMPRVVGFFDVPASYDLQNNTFAINLGFNPWILVNNCPGNLSDDGVATGYSGIALKWTGSQLQGRYISKNQRNWSQTLQGRGLRIPIAQFVGI